MFGIHKSIWSIAIAGFACSWASPGLAQSISQKGSTLTITGNTNSDDISVTGGAIGEVTVTNNQNADVDVFTGIQRINIDLRGGSDDLSLANIDIDGGLLSVKMGADNDFVTTSGTFFANISLDGELGEDDLFLVGTTVFGNVAIFGGIRDDVIDVSTSFVDGDLHVDAQAGDDVFFFSGALVTGQTRIDLGIGHDFASGSGALFEDDVVIIAGLGDDDIFNSTKYVSRRPVCRSAWRRRRL